jgi:hypothetical protein
MQGMTLNRIYTRHFGEGIPGVTRHRNYVLTKRGDVHLYKAFEFVLKQNDHACNTKKITLV